MAAMFGVEDARAAGGAHVVDDAEVETPGLCHAESWATRLGDDRGLINVSPACTLEALPTVELGASIQHGWHDGERHTQVGPAIKVALRPVERGIGLGVALSAMIDARSGAARGATAIIPVTADLSDRVRVNLNLGYQWTDEGDRHAAFAGAQIDVKAGDEVSVMAEVFGRDRGKAGFQVGVRWTPAGWIDLDLLGGHRVDGESSTAVTVGLTVRG